MVAGTMGHHGESEDRLQKSLKQRHLTMIALGGIIGAGLFVGSGALIHQVGPVAVVSYIATGVLVVLVMRMLGEMAAAYPSVGSFADYARTSLGESFGFAVGWLYWYFWVIVLAIEATAGAAILRHWVPGLPLWAGSLGLIILLTLTNLASVRSYGEFEFWFASIKILAIIIFLLLGVLYVVGLWPGHSMSFANLTAHGGFAPNGWGGAILGINVIIFSYVGAEIVTIAAAESENPAKAVARATRSVVWRILTFYIGSIFLITVILPWNSAKILESPFVSALRVMGVGNVSEIMNIVVLTAVLSCLNSGLYTASRMLFGLAQRGDAPGWLLHITTSGVPLKAILVSTLFGYIGVVLDYIWPDTVFLFLLNSSGAIALFVYLLIALSELRMRRRIEREAPERLRVRMWFFPYLSIITAVLMGIVILSMALTNDNRPQLAMSTLSVVAVFGLFYVKRFIESRGTLKPRTPMAVIQAEGRADADERCEASRVLVVANETVGATELLGEIRRLQCGTARFYVIVPARIIETGQGPVWAEESVIAAAQSRLDRTLRILDEDGIRAEGTIGDYRPLVAIKDAVGTFKPDLIVISTPPEGQSRWLRQNLIELVRRQFDIDVRHVVSQSSKTLVEPAWRRSGARPVPR